MTGGWAATNTFRAYATHRGPFFNWDWETGLVPPHDDDCPGCQQDAALALVEAALDAADDVLAWKGPKFRSEYHDRLDALAAALRAVREG